MDQIVEILLYRLQPATGADFHRIMREVSVPLHRSVGMDVVCYGRSLNDPDGYYLIRAYRDLDHLEASQAAFYQSDAWRRGPRADIVGRIDTSTASVLSLPLDAINALRRDGP